MINGQKFVVIASDASSSFGTKTHKGTGFAYYIRTDEHILKEAWFEYQKLTANLAEVRCLIKALEHILFLYKFEPVDATLVLNLDSDFVKSLIYLKFSPQKAHKYALYHAHLSFLLDHFDNYAVRVMKSHHFTGSKSNYMNRWCDKNARLQLRSRGQASIRNHIPNPGNFRFK